MKRSVFAVATLLALAACSGTPPLSVVRVAPRAAPPPVPRWEAVVLPDFGGSPLRAAGESDGATDVVMGTQRARVHGESVEWAHDVTLRPIVAYARDGEQWLFATEDGALFRADTFTAPLVRLGDAGGRAMGVGFDSAGVLATLAADEHLWLGAVAGGFRAAPAPADGPLVDAGFVDRQFGVAVVAPGRLLRTTDGGAHYDPVDLGAEAVYVVYPNPDGFVVDTTGGRRRVGPSGLATPFTGPSGVTEYHLADDEAHALAASVTRDHPLAYPMLLESGLPLSDGRVVTVEESDLLVHGPRGAARVALPGRHCALLSWGSRVLVPCLSQRDFYTELYVFDGDSRLTLLRRVHGSRVVAALDGGAVVVEGDCDDDAPSTAQGSVCWYDGGAWRARTLPARSQPLAVAGDALLYQSVSTNPTAASVRLVRAAESGDGAVVALEGGEGELLDAAFTSTGGIAGVATREGQTLVALGPPEGPLALRPLPEGARRAAFVDETRGIAAGLDLAHVWVTTDGARTWAPLALPVDGDASGASIELRASLDRDARAGVSCTATACFVGSRLIWTAPLGDVAPPYQPVRTLAAPRAPARDDTVEVSAARPRFGARPADTFVDGFRAGAWACERRVAPGARGAVRGPFAPPAERLYGGDGWLDAPRAPSDAAPMRGALVWGAADERGRFTARSQPGAVPPLVNREGTARYAVEATPLVVSRTLALLERCAQTGRRRECDVLAVPLNGAPRVVGTYRALLEFESDWVDASSRGALALPDGGAALHLALGGEHAVGPSVDVVLRLNARGEVVARRGYAWGSTQAVRMLALGPQGPGLATIAVGARAVVFHGLGAGDAGTPVGELPHGTLAACGGAAVGAPGAVSFLAPPELSPAIEVGSSAVGGGPFEVHARYEAESATGFCLRGVTLEAREPAGLLARALLEEAGGLPRLRAVNGALQGAAVDRTRDTPLACTGP